MPPLQGERSRVEAVGVHFNAAGANILEFAWKELSGCDPDVTDEAVALAHSRTGVDPWKVLH